MGLVALGAFAFALVEGLCDSVNDELTWLVALVVLVIHCVATAPDDVADLELSVSARVVALAAGDIIVKSNIVVADTQRHVTH